MDIPVILACGYEGPNKYGGESEEGGKTTFITMHYEMSVTKKLIFFWSHASENEFLFPLESKK